MNKSDKENFTLCVRALFETFSREATTALLHGYWLGLSDMPLESVQMAVARSIRECGSLPTPHDLRRLAGFVRTEEEASALAWSDVLKAVPLGPYKHIDFEDKVINAVVRYMGGWVVFLGRFSSAESEKWVRIEFERAYKNLSHCKVQGDAIKPLVGLSNAEVINGEVVEPVPRIIESTSKKLLGVVREQRRIATA